MKPAELEKLQGNPGHRPANKNAPVPDTAIPGPPKYLKHIGRRAYHDLVGLVGPDGMRVMAASDRLALTLICEAFEEYRDCKAEIEDVGRYWLLPNGTMKKHPAIGDMQNAWGRIMTGLGKFGLTPYERQKIVAMPEDKGIEMSREEEMAERRKEAIAAAKDKKHLKTVVNG